MAKQDVLIELHYAGGWHEAPAYTRDPVSITHGRTGQEPTPATAKLTLDNRTGLYNPRDPTSTLYGMIGRNTPIRISVAGDVQFYGEVSSWRPRKSIEFDAEAGRGDAWTEIDAAGILRRLGQGQDPLQSAARAAIVAAGPAAYWPLEDGEHATRAASAVAGVQPLKIRVHPFYADQGIRSSVLPKFGKQAGTPGSAPLPDFTDGGYFGAQLPELDTTGEWEVHVVAGYNENKYPNPVGFPIYWYAGDDLEFSLQVRSISGTPRVRLGIGGLAAGIAEVVVDDLDLWDGQVHHWQVRAAQDGSDLVIELYVDGVLLGQAVDQGTSGAVVGTLAPISEIYVNPLVINPTDDPYDALPVDPTFGDGPASVAPFTVGHVAIFNELLPDTGSAVVDAVAGHLGETAGRRIERLCDEADVTFTSTGDLDDTVAMGPQRVLPLLDLLAECERTDSGILSDPVDSLGLHYRTRASLYNQTASLALDASAGQIGPGLDPVVDDQDVANDVTASNPDGDTAQVVQDTGPMSVQAPPDGIGRYSTRIDVNPSDPDTLTDLAAWRLAEGTIDETRYPRTVVDLDADPDLVDQVAAVTPGDLVTIDGVEVDQVAQLVTAWTETIGSHRRTVDYRLVPASVWQVGELEGDADVRADTAGSVLAAAYTAGTDTSMLVHTTDGPRWITTDDHASHFPLEVRCAGVRVEVTGIAAPVTDAFGRTETDGWGTSESGFVWTRSGGSASDFSVSGGTGRHSLGSVNSSRRTYGGDYEDVEVRVKVTIPVIAATDSIDVAIMLRHADSSNYYHCVLHCHDDETVDVRIRKVVGGVFATLYTSHLIDGYGAGSEFYLQARAHGTTLQAKAWEISRSEPDWQAETTDTDLTSGGIGLRSNLQINNTNSLPQVIEYDDFEVLSPQMFTVTQAPVNGVTKSISAGEAVSLWTPWRAAL